MDRLNAWLEQAALRATPHWRATGRPLVSLCYAQSIDGSLTAQRGRPLALSGPQSGRLTHRLRAQHDAILVGVGAVLADDPQLTVRRVKGRDPQPVVLDSRLRCPPGARLLSSRGGPALIASTPQAGPEARAALQAAGAQILELPAGADGCVDLPSLLDALGERGTRSLMVEGGARVITSFLTAGLVDQVIITIAPLFVGGLNALAGLVNAGPAAGPFPRLQEAGSTRLGEDFILWGRLAPAEGTHD